jgi:hypothetical protein
VRLAKKTTLPVLPNEPATRVALVRDIDVYGDAGGTEKA